MKKLLCTLLCLTSMLFVASCKKNKPTSESEPDSRTSRQVESSEVESESSEESQTIIDGLPVTVYFFHDYNHSTTKEALLIVQSKNGELIAEHPADLTESYYEEFPVFKGWSQKELIDSEDDLWDFEHDVVQSYTSVLRIYGIWVAEGE